MKQLQLTALIMGVALLSVALNLSGFILDMGYGQLVKLLGLPLIPGRILTVLLTLLSVVVMALLLNRFLFKARLGKLLQPFNGRALAYWLMFALLLPAAVGASFFLLASATLVHFDQAPWYTGILAALVVAAIPAVVEEIAYRYVLYGYLRTKLKKPLAVLLTTLFFTGLHLNQVSSAHDAMQLLVAGLLGTALFVAIYEYTGSIWPGALVHTLWNATTSSTGLQLVNNFQEPSEGHFRFLTIQVESQNPLVVGNSFGVETSIIVTLIFCLSAATLFYLASKKPKALPKAFQSPSNRLPGNHPIS